MKSVSASRRTVAGFSLIELLIAVSISVFLMGGALYVFSRASGNYRTTDSVSRLQENARFALDVLEPDIRMTSFLGYAGDPILIANSPASTAAQDTTILPAAGHICGRNAPLDLSNFIYGGNNAVNFGVALQVACAPTAYRLNTDTLTVKRASANFVAVNANALQIYTARREQGDRLFSAAVAPGTIGPDANVSDVVVRMYYISNQSDARGAAEPALRRKRFTTADDFTSLPGGWWVDEEVVPGVEDMQVEFGVDPGFLSNGVRVWNGIPVRYVPPNAVVATDIVVAVRVFLRMRAEAPEIDYRDPAIYGGQAGATVRYGDAPNFTPNDGFRRLLVSKTVQLRNTWSWSVGMGQPGQ
jgi:type IV pilus assembly protein PilW